MPAVRIFLAGGTGVIGIRLIPLLRDAGHHVAGMTRSAQRADAVRDAGAEPVVCDVYDGAALRDAVTAYAPDAVINELTDLPDDVNEIPATTERGARCPRSRPSPARCSRSSTPPRSPTRRSPWST